MAAPWPGSAILLGATFQAAELKSPVAYPLKREYSLLDFERSARFSGVPLKMPGASSRSRPRTPRACSGGCGERGDVSASHWARHCLRAYFARGVDLSDRAALKALAPGSASTPAKPKRSGTSRVEGAPEGGQRCGDRARRLRGAVLHGRRRAVLGQRPARADRALAREGAVLNVGAGVFVRRPGRCGCSITSAPGSRQPACQPSAACGDDQRCRRPNSKRHAPASSRAWRRR